MTKHHWLVVPLFSMAVACSNHSKLAANAPLHTAIAAHCAETGAEPSLTCSQTVTATFAADGKLWLAWVDRDHVYVQWSDDAGATLSTPIKVNPSPEPIIAHDEYRPKIALDASGHIYLTWNRSLEKRHTGNIRFSRSADGGLTFSEPVTVNDNLDVISHRFDSLNVGANGEVLITWLDARDKVAATAAGKPFDGTSLYYAWSDNGGQSFHPNRPIAEHTCECCRLATAIDGDNRPVVMWRAVLPGGIRDHVLVNFRDWATPGDVVRVSHENWQIDACPHHGPALAVSDNGRYHAVWFSGAERSQGLFYARSDDQGKHFGPAMAFGGATAKHPHVATLGQQVAIVWTEFDGRNTTVHLLESLDDGRHWQPSRQIAGTAAQADYAFLVRDNERLYLSWQSREGYRLAALENL